jgi:ABC-type transporter Mla subunit MlaD
MLDDLDRALDDLQRSLANLSTISSVVITLRQSATKLLEPLKSVLHETRDAIDVTLRHLS